MVLGVLGLPEPAFSQGALFEFRERLIAHTMDRRLLERTAEIGRNSGVCDGCKFPRTLRVAVDSSPLERAGREDRRVSVTDGEMRHGRKTKSKRFNGYKRHLATDMTSDAIVREAHSSPGA